MKGVEEMYYFWKKQSSWGVKIGMEHRRDGVHIKLIDNITASPKKYVYLLQYL